MTPRRLLPELTMTADETAALAAQRAVYAVTVHYTGAGLTAAAISAVRLDEPAEPMQGFSGRAARVGFEIAATAFSADPDKDDLIVEADGQRWLAIDTSYRREIDAWVIWVEQAAEAAP